MSRRRQWEEMQESEDSSDEGSDDDSDSEGFNKDDKHEAEVGGSEGKHFYQYDSDDDDDDDDSHEDDNYNDDAIEERGYGSFDDGEDESDDGNSEADSRNRYKSRDNVNIPLAERLKQQEVYDVAISSSNAPSIRRKQRKNRESELGEKKEMNSVNEGQALKSLKRRNKNAPSVMPSNRAVKRFREDPNLLKTFKPHDPR